MKEKELKELKLTKNIIIPFPNFQPNTIISPTQINDNFEEIEYAYNNLIDNHNGALEKINKVLSDLTSSDNEAIVNEQERVQAEEIRVNNEEERKTEETKRIAMYNTHLNDEIRREQKHTEMVNTFNTKVSEVNTFITTKGQEIQDAINTIPPKSELIGQKGDKGDKGEDGLTVSIFVNGETYVHSEGVITLPDYPKEISTDAQSTSFDNSSNGMEATNVQDAIEENKTSILSLQELVGQANQTLIEECNKLLDI